MTPHAADLIRVLQRTADAVSGVVTLAGVADVSAARYVTDAAHALRAAHHAVGGLLTDTLTADAATVASARVTSVLTAALAARAADHAVTDAARWCRRAYAALALAPDHADAVAVALTVVCGATADVVTFTRRRVDAVLRAHGDAPATAERSAYGGGGRADRPLHTTPSSHPGGVAVAPYVLVALTESWRALRVTADALVSATHPDASA